MQSKANLSRSEEFNRSVRIKFDLYNSLFLNLPYKDISATGATIPLLSELCKRELAENRTPEEILTKFFEHTLRLEGEEAQIGYMFRVIQFVERQVVLFDSVEDAAFSKLNASGKYLRIKDIFGPSGYRGADRERTLQKLNDFSTRLVFTAHPTQFYPPAVLEIITKLGRSITDNDIEDVYLILRQLGLTSLLNNRQPTPLDEARNIIYYLRTVYYDSLAELYGDIKSQFDPGKLDNPRLISLGFWPGGDRDGNPYVTAGVTRAVADELRMAIAKSYYNNLKELQSKLTFKGVAETLDHVRKKLYNPMFDPQARIPLDDIRASMLEVKESVIQDYQSLFLNEVDNFIDKLDIFKSHFASMDIRQDHSVHLRLVTEILIHNGKIRTNLEELSQKELSHILAREMLSLEDLNLNDPVLEDTLVNIPQLKEIQAVNGIEGCHRYIISNSEDIYSVLFVYALFRWSGYAPEEIHFDIVPLFETMKGMDASAGIMRELFNLPFYAKHLERRNRIQTVMLGFSDGTKDGGYLKANWSIYKTKESLTSICNEHGYEVIFFDGRGGPPARGGGKTHRFYASQGKNISNKEIHLTIQGQTITSTFGTKERFKHNCEQLITAGISENTQEISPANRKIIEKLSHLSFEKYLSLKNHEKFIPYLEEKSTLRYYKQAKIGSRPGKRGNKAKLELKDLRAISFVGSWSQLKQNVPGYYGIGTALQAFEKEDKLGDAGALVREVPFFKALILNSMMSLEKSYFELTSYMKNDKAFADFWMQLYEEYLKTEKLVLEITGYDSLMEEEPISKQSIMMREHIVLPLLVIQQYALQQISRESPYAEQYEKIVVRSLYGNINASRNSA